MLRRHRIELILPIAVDPSRDEALLTIGMKRSEEPYSREDLDLLLDREQLSGLLRRIGFVDLVRPLVREN